MKHHATNAISILICAGIAGIFGACSNSTSNPPAVTTHFAQTNLVSDTASFSPAHIDANLLNAWGIAFSATGKPWIASNHGSVSTIYDTAGNTVLAPVTIPVPGATTGGAPSGAVFNANSTDFGGNKFLFSTEDGTICGWASGSAATIVSDQSSTNAIFKGLAIVPSMHQIFATDFHNNKVVIFNSSFGVVSSFTDPTVPAGYAPFGIQNINDTLYVTFARQKAAKDDDSSGASIGYVDRFTTSGTMIGGHFASGGNLNSPWGIALAPASFGQYANDILIGNFGDGKMTAFSQSGSVVGQLSTSAGTISIPGLWGISFNPTAGSDPNKLFFTAGPDGESHGLFGYLTITP